MEIGRLTERVTLSRMDRALSASGTGAEVHSWVDVATVWAEADSVGAREGFAGAARFADNTYRFRIRYRGDLEPTWRLTWRGRVFDVAAVLPGGAQLREWLDVTATAGPGQNPVT